jgi:ATP-dependent helicase/nuclease subunit B
MLDALFSGQLIAGFFPSRDPLALASTTIYLPTRRAERLLTERLLARFAPHPVLLPRMIPLADLGNDELGDENIAHMSSASVLPVLSRIERRLVLTSLVQSWGKTMKQALFPLDRAQEEPLLVPASLADACAMAADLARLLDDMTLWQTPFEALDLIQDERFDVYFSITKQFLSIIRTQWPQLLAQWGMTDPTVHQDALLREYARRIREQQNHGALPTPLIVIGSTGTLPATADFLDAVARHPQGAIVLPCLDQDLDAPTFMGLQNALHDDPSAYTHPQAVMARLLKSMSVSA